MNANNVMLHCFSTQRRNKCLSKAAIFVTNSSEDQYCAVGELAIPDEC